MPYKVRVVEDRPDRPERTLFRSGRRFSSKYYSYVQDDQFTNEIAHDRELETVWIDAAEFEQGQREARKRK